MGKNMYTKPVDDELEDINPSCMGGIMHAIDYHHWRYNVKRMLPHRKNQGRHAKSHASPKRRALEHSSSEIQTLVHEEETASHVNKTNKESASTNKRSLRARIKALISDQTHAHSRLERTNSIQHLELSDHGLEEICTDWEHPIVFFPENEDVGGTNLPDQTKSNVTRKPAAGQEKFNQSSNMAASKGKLKEHTDVLEMFKVNKELFLEILKNVDDGIKKLRRTSPASQAKSRLTKSGSFPVGDLSQIRNRGPTKLKHKQREAWSAPPGEKYLMDLLNYSKYLLLRSRSSPENSSTSGTRLGRALSLILQSTMESDKEGPRDYLTPLKENKQAIPFDRMKGKSETNSCHSVLAEVSNKEESSTLEKDFADMNKDGDSSSCRSFRRDDIGYRSSSLSESMDKYTSLFESNFGKEVILRSSKSLRLSNENEMRSGKSASFLFRRIRSLSQLDEFHSSLQNVLQAGGIFADWPITSAKETSSCIKGDTQGGELKPTEFSTCREEYLSAHDTKEPEHQSDMIERIDIIQPVGNSAELGEDITEECAKMEDLPEQVIFHEKNSYGDEETNNLETTCSKFPESSSISASENSPQDEASGFWGLQPAEGLESRCDLANKDSSIDLRAGIDAASSSLLSSLPNLENIAIPDHMKAMEKNIPNRKGDTDLDYVRDLLERSGFTNNAFKWTWHSLDQPLSPSVFEAMEAYWHQEQECSKEDLWCCYHHQLLFELVNEELARLFDRSYTYYPRAVSSSCHVRPFPVRNHLVEEIFSSIIPLISLNPEKMRTLDSIVDLDLKKNDGWMNLQLESEGLALELEDMIFDELLAELLLFELVNEELARLFDRSYTYYPRAVSSSCHVRPFPVRNHLVEEIFSSIIPLISLNPEKMRTLDSIVDLDLKKNDGWMNLQLESEGLALELEDMIFDELLAELVCL